MGGREKIIRKNTFSIKIKKQELSRKSFHRVGKHLKTEIMLKNISSLGKTLNKEQQQSINGGAPTPWDHPQNQECTQGDQKCDCWTSCGTGENENTQCLCDNCKGSFFNCE